MSWPAFLIPDPQTEGDPVLLAASMLLGVYSVTKAERGDPSTARLSDDMMKRLCEFHGIPRGELPCSVPELLVGTEMFTLLTTVYSDSLGHLSATPRVTLGMCQGCRKPEFNSKAESYKCRTTRGCTGKVIVAKAATVRPAPPKPAKTAKPADTQR